MSAVHAQFCMVNKILNSMLAANLFHYYFLLENLYPLYPGTLFAKFAWSVILENFLKLSMHFCYYLHLERSMAFIWTNFDHSPKDAWCQDWLKLAKERKGREKYQWVPRFFTLYPWSLSLVLIIQNLFLTFNIVRAKALIFHTSLPFKFLLCIKIIFEQEMRKPH